MTDQAQVVTQAVNAREVTVSQRLVEQAHEFQIIRSLSAGPTPETGPVAALLTWPQRFFLAARFHLQPADSRIQRLGIKHRGKSCRRFSKNLHSSLAQLPLPARDFDRGQLVAGGQVKPAVDNQ